MDYILTTSTNDKFSINKSLALLGHINKTNSYGKIVLEQINNGVYSFLKKPWGTVLDVGANIGLFSYFICGNAKQVFAVEPSQEHFMVLRAGIKDFNLQNITPFNVAIGTFTGESIFYLNSENSTMNTLLTKHENISYKQKVTVNTLLDFIKTNNIDNIDLVKMDIEGSEIAVVPHSSFQESTKYINNIYIEAHDFDNNGKFLKENTDKIEKLLNNYGYKTTRIMIDGVFGEKI